MGPEKGLYLSSSSDRIHARAAAGLISIPEGGKPSWPRCVLCARAWQWQTGSRKRRLDLERARNL